MNDNIHHIDLTDTVGQQSAAKTEAPKISPAEQLDAVLKPVVAEALADVVRRLDHLSVTSVEMLGEKPGPGVALAHAITLLATAVRDHYGLATLRPGVAAACAQPDRAERPRMTATGNVFLPAEDEIDEPLSTFGTKRQRALDGRSFTRSVYGWFVDDFIISELNNTQDALLGLVALVETSGKEPAFISGTQLGAMIRALAEPMDHLSGMMPGMWARESDIPTPRHA